MAFPIAILGPLFKLGQTVIGMDVLDKLTPREQTWSGGKPLWYTRRFWGAVILALCTAVSFIKGIAVPEAEVNGLTDAVMQIVDVFSQNEALWGSLLGAWTLVVGIFRRRKA